MADQTKSITVLLVDDEPMTRKYLRLILVRAGCEVTGVEDAEEALAYLCTHSPNLIILDAMMPGMDGFELCEAIRADDSISHIPVILLSARTDFHSRQRGLAVGAIRYLTKPIAPNLLTKHVLDVLDMPAFQQPSPNIT